ncbi:hypothetical protein COU80_00970 [Candidatus Peregrinibacteria bacterium CG10_big_fil_rev_8_21_14_0_10_55_24]|nr:MAG: hypothetical protein COU80_00970 [Candidatus Peregrinibacteria bacterium CG10_big_fil_rev_8_21_14_0_10_55_24]
MAAKAQEIVGHTVQREELSRDLSLGNVSHAYLFCGKRHLGKMAIARWFALEILLQGVPPEERARAQGQIERLVHPDLLILDQLWIEDLCEDWELISKFSNVSQQHRAKKPAAKTDTISIDDIRMLQERLYETGTGLWRCCIIRSIERMQDPAANAFLKILEEPPPGLVFLLTTQALGALLPTVVSRTRKVMLRPLPRPEMLPLLTDISPDDAQFILHVAQGAPGWAVRLRDDSDALREQRLMHAQAQAFWQSHSPRERLQILAPLHKRDEYAEQFLTHLALTLREHMPQAPLEQVHALSALADGLKTNAHRQILAQQFALAIGS